MSEIFVKLSDLALDGEYWADVLKDRLGITKIEQILYVSAGDLEKIRDEIRYDWEEMALRKFFNISQKDYEATSAKSQKESQKQIEEAKNLLKDISKLRQKSLSSNDAMMKSKLDQLRKLINAAKDNEHWSAKCDDANIEDLINKVKSDIGGLKELAEGRPLYDPPEIIEKASAGSALRGVLVGEMFSKDCVKGTVLCTPENEEIKWLNPSLSQVDECINFSSKAQSDNFQGTLAAMGYSVAKSIKGGYWGFQAEAGLTNKNEREYQEASETHTKMHFHSRLAYSIVPTVACELSPTSLKLSQPALKELKIIDRLLCGSQNQELVNKKCKEFMKSYGSHVNGGILHFGGIHQVTATYSSQTESASTETKSLMQDALNAYSSAIYAGVGVSVGGSISADKLESRSSFTADYQKSDQAKVSLMTTRIGGPQEVSSFSLWKMGLVTYNSTWALIDRGKTLCSDFIGIWELIYNNKNEFQEPYQLESSLKRVWENMSGFVDSLDQERTVSQVLDEMDMLMNKMSTWTSHPVLPERCIEYLHEILGTVEKVQTHTGTNKYWEKKLNTEPSVGSFLGKVVELKDSFNERHLPMLRFLMRKLITASGSTQFPNKQDLITWAELNSDTVDIPSLITSADVTDIQELIRLINETFLPALRIEHAKNELGDECVRDRINAGATVDFALCVSKFMKHLQLSEKPHEFFFLRVTLLHLQYQWPDMVFYAQLTLKKLEDFIEHIEKSWKSYNDHKIQGNIRLEAFLIENSLTSGHFDKQNEASEELFSGLLTGLRKVLSPQINMVLNMYATNSPFDWDQMTRITGEVAEGNLSALEKSEPDIHDLHQVLAPLHSGKQNEQIIEAPITRNKAQGAFLGVLQTLGIEEHYPSTISLSDAIVVRKANHNPKLLDIPWVIISKLFMIDFNARDTVFSAAEQSNENDSDSESEFFGQQNIDACTDEAANINTLDAFVAIFVCCDNFLKQKLVQKLFVCKLAIPFLYPLGSNNMIGMSLWALRTITVQGNTKYGESAEIPVTNKPFPLVTFVRLGRPPLSKSKLMNEILRDQSHDTFFHHDCSNGNVPREISNGLVECSWFISANKENEILPGTTMLLNLRGDASSLNKQMEILEEISSVIFIIVTAKDLTINRNSKEANMCQEIIRSSAKVILFLISAKQTKKNVIAEQSTCAKVLGEESLKEVRLISSRNSKGIEKNASELKNEARKQLSKALVECPRMMLEQCAELAKKKMVVVDEYGDEACLEGKAVAEKVVQHMEGQNIEDCKASLLPLQGTVWFQYCKQLKEQHRTGGKNIHSSSSYQAEKAKQNMNRLREAQVKICSEMTPFIKDFMVTLQNYNDDHSVVLYFLKWIQMLMDEKSRAFLPNLRKQYHKQWADFQQAKEKQEKEMMATLKPLVAEAEKKLASASLGLESLFRELGQIYEAVKGCPSIGEDTKRAVEHLTEIAAKLLLEGVQLELVDGDASSVPLSWVGAVLRTLDSIIEGKKLFVISVLGIQSSGKSTLLNTMFGLQFAVSAGRCTRGAYMQLISVADEAELPFDYLVVVDTEGLRAPELGDIKYEHDNELATFVIGLGDVTMLNIKGENTAEIKDILQIAVHAFLRMNLVSKNTKDHRTCIFVHQNVPAADAEEMMMQGCQKLKESLDNMAEEAALSENIANIHSFSQIISFDVKKHVWFFSDLWHGNPPMAPANPGYSEKVDAVRDSLLNNIAKKQKTFLTASDLSIRVADLWNGVLADDFVFSFRNSLEVKAYNNLQSTYYTLEWELQSELRNWLQASEIKLNVCDSLVELQNCFQLLTGKLSEVLALKAEDIEARIIEYFENSNFQDIIIQWQHSKLKQLSFALEQLQNEGKTDLLSIKEARQVEILQSQKWSQHELHIMNKAIELADRLKGKGVTHVELQNKFDDMWIKMVNELTTNSADKELDMVQVMRDTLEQRFHSQGKALREELHRHPLRIPLRVKSLVGSIDLEDVRKEHISLKSLWLKLRSAVFEDLEVQARRKTVQLTDSILQKVSTYLKELLRQDMKFQKSHATEVIKMLCEKIDDHNNLAHDSKDIIFTIRHNYYVKLAVHVSRHCVEEFTVMQSEYNKKHGVKAKIENYKNTAWSLFGNMVKQSTEEVMAGDLLCTHLKTVIEKAVKKVIPGICVEEVLRDFQMTKYYLIVKMMDDLACKGNFKEYEFYIHNAKEYALKWITNYTDNKMFTRKDGSNMSRYAEIAISHIKKIIRCISHSVKYATDHVDDFKGTEMMVWIDRFSQKVSEEIAVPVSSLTAVSSRKVGNFSNLQRVILDQLDKSVEAPLVNAFSSETKYTVRWDGPGPPQQVLDKIWGCAEQCPFCKEPCADTMSGHWSSSDQSGKSHMCVQHRPDGIGGGQWGDDFTLDGIQLYHGQLSHHTCNYCVQWSGLFRCGYCKYKCREYGKCTETGSNQACHKYTEYKTYLPDWDIAPDRTNEVSKYWMWFMATYQAQLKDMYNAKSVDIPKSWMSISKEDALKDLRQIHH